MRVNKFHICWQIILIILKIGVHVSIIKSLLFYKKPFHFDLIILLLDELMAMLKTSREETYVFELFLVKYLCNASKYF